MELEKITEANKLYGCLGIILRYSEILEFKSKDGEFPNYDQIRFLFHEKIMKITLKREYVLLFALKYKQSSRISYIF